MKQPNHLDSVALTSHSLYDHTITDRFYVLYYHHAITITTLYYYVVPHNQPTQPKISKSCKNCHSIDELY